MNCHRFERFGARVIRRGLARTAVICVLAIQYSILFASAPVQAQLNENCVISILNRTAQVQPDGSWRIANVPGSFGSLRARATCVENGVTLTGESSLFVVEEGIVNGFDAEIVLGAVDPIPVSLAVTTPSSTLTSAGAPSCLELELPK